MNHVLERSGPIRSFASAVPDAGKWQRWNDLTSQRIVCLTR